MCDADHRCGPPCENRLFSAVVDSSASQETEKLHLRSGAYTPNSKWDPCTDFTYRWLVTTVCGVLFLSGINCVLLACEKGWFVDSAIFWMGGCTGQTDSASGFLPPHSVSRSTDTCVTLGLGHATFCCQDLLLRSGSVEVNPGPPKAAPQTRQGSASRRASVDRGVDKTQTTDAGATSGTGLAGTSGETVRDDPSLRDIMTMLVSLNSKFDNMQSDIQEVKRSNEQMKTEIEGIKETVHDLKAENDRLRKQTTDMQERLDTLTLKADDLECRSKRHNVIFYGLHRPDGETGQDCEDALQDFLTDKLELSRTIEFDRVHRLNSKPNSPVIARCTYFKDKNTILKARYKLKGSNIFLGEDFSVRVREIRKKLGPHLKAARDQGKRATMIFDHLLINGKKFTLDSENELKEIR